MRDKRLGFVTAGPVSLATTRIPALQVIDSLGDHDKRGDPVENIAAITLLAL